LGSEKCSNYVGDDTVIGDVKAYQERMSDETVNSYQVRQGKTETTANSDALSLSNPVLPDHQAYAPSSYL